MSCRRSVCQVFYFCVFVVAFHAADSAKSKIYDSTESSDIGFCARNPCKNKGICHSLVFKKTGGYTFECLCLPYYTGILCEHPPKIVRDCQDFLDYGKRRSGVYRIYPEGSKGFDVFCDMTTDGGGWTVFQRRINGSVDFYKGWNDYKHGFGHLNGEYWLGNDNLHELVSQGSYRLRVDLEDFSNQKRYAKYSTFSVAGIKDIYQMHVGGYTGNAGDSLSYHNGKNFTTKDEDEDTSKANCAILRKGAFWYGNCHTANLNGLYLRGKTKLYAEGLVWKTWHGYYYSLKASTMMVKRQ